MGAQRRTPDAYHADSHRNHGSFCPTAPTIYPTATATRGAAFIR